MTEPAHYGKYSKTIRELHETINFLSKFLEEEIARQREAVIDECAKVVEKCGLDRVDDVKDYPATVAAAIAFRIRSLSHPSQDRS